MIEIFCSLATARVLSKYDPAKGIYFLALVLCNSNKQKKTCSFSKLKTPQTFDSSTLSVHHSGCYTTTALHVSFKVIYPKDYTH